MVGCGINIQLESSTESSVTEVPENPTEAITEGITEKETEAKTEAVTEAPTEETTEEETEIPTEEEVSISDSATMTNIDLIRIINQAFGMITDGTDESEITVAQDWDIIDSDFELDRNAPITKEFLISSVVRATGFKDGSASFSEIVICAVEKGIIDTPNLDAIDLADAVEIVEKAESAWSHQEFDNEISVTLCDGVIDLSQELSISDFTIDGESITISGEFSSEIKEGTVFILPKNPNTGEGGAYKAESVTDNGFGILIKAKPADFMEVYAEISSN